MSVFSAAKTLSDTVERVLVPLVNGLGADRAIAAVAISGTFVGTLKIQKSTDNAKTWADCTVTNIVSGAQANPTAAGNYAADLGASATHGRVIFSAYTSGSALVSAVAIPFI